MARETSSLALCAASQLSDTLPENGREWLHLLPAGGKVITADGRGPYTVEDYHALIAESLKPGDKLVLDVNHSTDLAAPKGMDAPAAGWITSLQLRADGVWGDVEYTPLGQRLRAEKAYRGVSPVIAHLKDKRIVGIRRASLVNQPNLQGLTALHSEENDMDWKKMLVEALGLAEDADDATIAAAAKKALGGGGEEAVQSAVQTALQSALSPIGTALGLAGTADATAIVTAIGGLKEQAAPDDDVISALQSQLTTTSEQLTALQSAITKKDAEAFVDAAIAEGRVGVKPLRDTYVTMHMENPERAAKLIGAMPKVSAAIPSFGANPSGRSTDLDEADRSVMALMGIDREAFTKARAAELGAQEEAL